MAPSHQHLSEPSPELQENLRAVIEASRLTAKRRGASVKPAVEALSSICYDRGLLPTELNELIDLITTPSFLDQASLGSIVRNMYPATSLEDDDIVKIVGCLGHGKLKASLSIQSALLKWLVMIQHIIKNQSVLSQAYTVLFNLLDTTAIRPPLCHLLALITRRRHVRPYRIQLLLSLSRQTGNDPAITGLLRVFKDYYPEIIVGEATRGKASTFKHPDPQWRRRLDEIQQAHSERITHHLDKPLDVFRVARSRLDGGKPRILPEVHTSHATENSITLEEIENVDGFVKNLETIELPNQLIAVLSDPLLQKFQLLRPQFEAQHRASNWLHSYAQGLLNGDTQFIEILDPLKVYVDSTRILPPVFLAILGEYIKIWNGREGRSFVLSILSYTPLLDFRGLLSQVFEPLEAKILDEATEDAQTDVLGFYTSLLRRWTTYLASRDQKIALASTSIADLIRHVNDLCLTVLQTSPGIATHSRILDFYEQTAALASNTQFLHQAKIVIPLSPLIYTLHFGASASTLSRLCGVLAKYKEGFQKVMTMSRSDYTAAYINEFNGFLMDICNCLWRSRAFNNADANSHGCLVSRQVNNDLSSYVDALGTGAPLVTLFSLSYSPVLGLAAISHLRELEDQELELGTGILATRHAGPVTRASLDVLASKRGMRLSWDDYRLGVLDYLTKRGMAGISELMNNTMTTLMRRKSSHN